MFQKIFRDAPLTLILLIALTSCYSLRENSDPHTGGFFGGLNGIFSGSYKDRIKERQTKLSNEYELMTKFKNDEHKYQLKISKLISEQKRIEELDKYLKNLSDDVNSLSSYSIQQHNKTAKLKTEIKKLQDEITKSHSDSGYVIDPKDYRMLEIKRDRLAKEYKALLDYFNSLSDASN